MEIKLEKMSDWERKKAIYLMHIAEELGMDTSGYGEVAVNPNSGYTYLWLEDYSFTLYLPISCELTKNEILALWTSPEDGEEKEFILDEDTTLEDLEDWANEQYKGE